MGGIRDQRGRTAGNTKELKRIWKDRITRMKMEKRG